MVSGLFSVQTSLIFSPDIINKAVSVFQWPDWFKWQLFLPLLLLFLFFFNIITFNIALYIMDVRNKSSCCDAQYQQGKKLFSKV